MTQRQMERNAKANIARWESSYMYSLHDAYGRFSDAKARAWEYCRDKLTEKNGRGLKVISRNTNIFTAGFVFMDYEDNNKVKFYYITPSYDVVVDYEEA